jgi:hypothetical protein
MGSVVKASSIVLPKNRFLASTYAINIPNTAIIDVAITETHRERISGE